MKLLQLIAIGAVALSPVAASAAGLDALAVSSDGNTIFVGGETRSIIQLNSDLEVTKRQWLGARVKQLALVNDESTLLVFDDSKSVRLFDAKTLKQTSIFEKVEKFSYTNGHDKFAVQQGSYSASSVNVISLADGSTVSTVPVPKEFRLDALALDAGSGEIWLVSKSVKNEEEKVSYNDIPKDLKGLEKENYKQMHDGYGNSILCYSAKGEQLASFSSSFKTGTYPLLQAKDGAAVLITYDDHNLRIGKDEKVKYFKSETLGYGKAFLSDKIIMGSLRTGKWLRKDNTVINFEIDKLPGFPEYFAAFAEDSSGKVYGTTSAYRIATFGADGSVVKTVPVL